MGQMIFFRILNKIERILLQPLFMRIDEVDNRINSIYDVLYYKKNRYVNHSKVIYTCLTGNYDTLFSHTYINFDYDYICFTDNERLLTMGEYGIWKIMPLQFNRLDNVKNNRWHKLHPHVLFPDYEESIYIDSNIDIKDDFLFDELNKDALLQIPIHRKRKCVYKECKDVIKLKRERIELVKKVESFLKTNGFPVNRGLTENGLIYRKHNNETVLKMMEMWWNMVENLSMRDQLTLPYVLWKFNILVNSITIPNVVLDRKHFGYYKHKFGYYVFK
jgi:hypothetical protein